MGLLANEFGCRYIRYVLRKAPKCDEPPKAKKACASFDTVLMAGQTDRDYFQKPKVVINRDDQLFNDVCGLLAERKIGFTRTAAPDEGYDVVNVLTNALRSIDGNHGTLDQASVKQGPSKIPSLPAVWKKFVNYDSSCSVCTKPRLSPQKWEMCSWLPDTQPNVTDPSKYLLFKELHVYGKDTTEIHRPGLKSKCEDKDAGSNLFTG